MSTNRRLQVDPGLRTPSLRPVAAPVDAFVRPDEDKMSQLGKALSSISPSVREFTGAVIENIDTGAENKGRLAASDVAKQIREEGLSLAEATRKGKLPASKNPFYMKGLREQLGRNLADTFGGDLKAAMGADENLQVSTNLGDFDTFAQKFREQWEKDHLGENQDDHFKQGYQFRSDAYLTAVRNEFANGIEGKVQTQGDQATFAEVFRHATDFTGKLPDAQVAGDINALTNDLIQKQGRNGRQVMQTTAAAIAAAAAANPEKGLKILELLKSVKGKEGALIATTYGSQLYTNTRDHVNTLLWNETQRESAQSTARQQAVVNATLTEATQELLKDPNADLRKYLSRLAGDPHAAEQLEGLSRNVGLLTFRTDEGTKARLFGSIWNGGESHTSVLASLRSGKLTVSDANFLIEQIDRRNKAAQDGPLKKALEDVGFRVQLDLLKQRFADPVTGIVASDKADKAAHASAMFIDAWTRRFESGESEKDKAKWLADKADEITKYQRGPDAMSGLAPAAPTKTGDGPIIEPLEKRLPPSLVLTADDFKSIQQGRITSNLQKQLTQFHIFPDEQAAFIAAQLKLLPKKKEVKK